jgi:hypothetical protein
LTLIGGSGVVVDIQQEIGSGINGSENRLLY